MYVPPLYRNKDHDEVAAFLRQRGFGLVVATGEDGPVGAHVPFIVDEDASGGLRLRFHVARGNPLWRLAGQGQQLLVSVTGPDAYVSPDWYVAANQVPTWNYVAVHCTGKAIILSNQDVRVLLSDLSAEQEGRLLPKEPWTLDKLSEPLLTGLVKAIVGMEMSVDRMEAQWKLSQNKKNADHDGVIAGLEARGEEASLAVAGLMRRRNARR